MRRGRWGCRHGLKKVVRTLFTLSQIDALTDQDLVVSGVGTDEGVLCSSLSVIDVSFSGCQLNVRPSVRTVLPPSATRVKAEGRVAALIALTKPVIAAMENFILNVNG
jgi:hypothetical protein